MGTIINPKYDNDSITLGYLKKALKEKGIDVTNKKDLVTNNYSSPPTSPYYKNSLLLQNNKIYKCIKDRLIGEFSWDDWTLVATDNSELKNFIDNTYSTDKITIQEQMDNKMESFYQTNDPSTNWTSNLEKEKHVGDYWYNTIDDKQWRYCRDTSTTIISYKWEQVNVPKTIYDLIDSKKSIYTAKPLNYKKDDLWIIEKELMDIDLPLGTTKNPIIKGDWVFCIKNNLIFDKNDWIKKDEDISKEFLEQHYYTSEVISEKFNVVNNTIDSKITKSKEEISLKVSQDYTTKIETNTAINDFGKRVDTVTTTVEKNTNTLSQLMIEKDNININISKIINDGVSKVKTETGYTFDKDGLNVSKTGEEMDNTIDNKGMYVRRDNTEMLGADSTGVRAENVTVRKYLTIGNHARIENYGNNRTGCFFV